MALTGECGLVHWRRPSVRFRERGVRSSDNPYAFNRFTDLAAVFIEMARVGHASGRVTVCEALTTSSDQGAAYDHMERHDHPSQSAP